MTLLIPINFYLLSFHFSLNYVSFLILFNFSFFLFSIGLLGTFYNRQNFLILLICIELMLLSIGLNFIFLSLISNKFSSIFMLFIITVAAAESSIGLGLLIILYRLKQTLSFENFSNLKS